ncbi:MAG: sulfur carrier protein ThiS [Candidatus Omnitrophica bacterium]|nr:sulfur carrier protein ThiS [Candidatus Omnitrophota bacterium]
MQIVVNGKKEEVGERTTVASLLKEKKIMMEMVAVELNGTVLPRSRYAETSLKEGDRVEFLYYMGGG